MTPRGLSPIDGWFARYGESHRNRINKALHAVCVPAITWCVLALAWWAAPWLAMAIVAAAMVFYARLSLPIAFAMLGFSALCVASFHVFGDRLGWVALAVFVLAWIGQFAGHRIEGRRPSFLEDLAFLLIGPAWLVAMVLRGVGLRY